MKDFSFTKISFRQVQWKYKNGTRNGEGRGRREEEGYFIGGLGLGAVVFRVSCEGLNLQ